MLSSLLFCSCFQGVFDSFFLCCLSGFNGSLSLLLICFLQCSSLGVSCLLLIFLCSLVKCLLLCQLLLGLSSSSFSLLLLFCTFLLSSLFLLLSSFFSSLLKCFLSLLLGLNLQLQSSSLGSFISQRFLMSSPLFFSKCYLPLLDGKCLKLSSPVFFDLLDSGSIHHGLLFIAHAHLVFPWKWIDSFKVLLATLYMSSTVNVVDSVRSFHAIVEINFFSWRLSFFHIENKTIAKTIFTIITTVSWNILHLWFTEALFLLERIWLLGETELNMVACSPL